MIKAIFLFLGLVASRFLWLTAWVLMLSANFSTLSLAANSANVSEISESQLRVAYVFNFTKFVTWPEGVNTDEYLTVCTYKIGLAQSDFNELNERAAGNQKIQVLDIQGADDESLNSCDFLYIGSQGASTKRGVLDALAERPVLTISEQPLQEPELMVSLLMVENKIAFEVDLQELRKNTMTVSSYMLRLALQVYE
jgi:hypothetical protein